ncbi:MAG TPA: SRPBCC domain-containing protein [Galbitalea sp.]|nr:SRPBCC domain-containing protein [Galbitalea sp.]
MNGFTITRDIGATPERVWAAFTDARQYAAWIWPADWHTTCEIDPRVGGSFTVASAPQSMEVHGTYVTVDPFSTLALTWRWHDDADESLLTITFEPITSGTRFTLKHENFASEKSRAAHEQGWSDCLDRLPGYLAAS